MTRSSLPCLAILVLFACDAGPAPAPKKDPTSKKDPARKGAPPLAERGGKPDAPPADPPPQDPTVIPLPDSLVAENIPPIPRTIAEAVGPYAEARSASVLGWHPKEPWLLVSTRFADTPQIHEVRGPGADRRQLTFFSDKVLYGAYPPVGPGDFLVFAKDIGGNEFSQNWRLDRATGKSNLLTDGVAKNSLGAWSNAGDRMAYTSTRRNKKDTDFYVIDPRDPRTDKLLAEVEGGGWNVLDWSPDDKTLLVINAVSINETYLSTIDIATGTRTQLTEKTDPPVAWNGGVFTADGTSVISTNDGMGEYKRLVRLDLADRKVTILSEPRDWDLDSFTVSRDRKRLVASINEAGWSTFHLHDLPSGSERPIMTDQFPKGVIQSMRWHPDGRRVGVTVSSARSPSDAYVYDTKTRSVERWTESEVGGLDPSNFSEPTLIKWKSFDDREIPGLYYRPPARYTGKRPVVVVIHGGPEGQSEAGFIGRQNYFLDEMGVAIIYPNVRGSTGYGKTYARLDNADKREDSVKDIGALLDWIATQPDLDADRVMITGGSYGGYMTLAASVHYADRIRCAIDIVGISNFVTFLENTEAYRRDLRRVEYGDERDPAMREHLQKISPLTRAAEIKKPLFVVQGRNDPRVPASEAHQIVATLKQNGTPVWYLEGKDEGHGFAKKRNQDYQMYATILFMQTYLLADGPPAAPAQTGR